MAVQKDRIVIGDTYHLSYSCFVRDGSMKQNDRQPVSPVLAEISLWNVIDQVFVPMNDDGDFVITVVPVGNKVEYVVPSERLVVDGDYKVFVTFIMDVGGTEHRETEIRQFRVQAKG